MNTNHMWPYGGTHVANISAAEGDLDKDNADLRSLEQGNPPYEPKHRSGGDYRVGNWSRVGGRTLVAGVSA